MLSETHRSQNLALFISNYFSNEKYLINKMEGDAGLRTYYRVKALKKSFIVMDCPPDYAKVETFVKVSNFLRKNKFTAPKIFAQDLNNGFLILEDFGNLSVKNYLQTEENQNDEKKYNTYCLVIDLLISLQKTVYPSFIKNFNNELLLSELEVFINWYIPYTYNRKLKEHEIKEFNELWKGVLLNQAPMPQVLLLRDFHLENMMYIKNRINIKKIGLLDFQDALYGSPIYDLVSVLEDARIDVPRDIALKLIDYFAQKTRFDKNSVLLNYHILGAQRNLRILGIFARKLLRDNNNIYIKYIPRVQKYLSYDLSCAALNEIDKWLKNLK